MDHSKAQERLGKAGVKGLMLSVHLYNCIHSFQVAGIGGYADGHFGHFLTYIALQKASSSK